MEFFSVVVSAVVKLIEILFGGRQQVVGLMPPPNGVGWAFARKPLARGYKRSIYTLREKKLLAILA
ncbi:MAG: hypothetical protein V3V97_00150 [Hyphomicrobiaceae bacterium]